MATTVYFNGRTIAVPGSYTTVDTSGLEQVGLSATGIVAVLGTAVGGRPIQTMTRPADFIRLSSAEQAAATFISGDLLEATNMLFGPSNDPNIASGAQQVIPMKVNNALQSSANLLAANGAPSISITSRDWGAYTSQIQVNLGAGSVTGRFLSLTLENRVESVDNLGGITQLNLSWAAPSGSPYTAVVAGVEVSGTIHAHGTIPKTFSADATALASGVSVTITAAAGDAGNVATIYGIFGGAMSVDTLTLASGSNAVPKAYTKLLGVKLSRPASAAVAIKDTSSNPFATIAAGATTAGIQTFSPAIANNAAQPSGPINFDTGATAQQFIVEGPLANGTIARELVTTTSGGLYKTTNYFSQLNAVVGGAATGTVNVAPLIARANTATATTLQKVVNYFKALPGFTANLLGPDGTQSSVGLDATVADTSITSTPLAITNDKAMIVNWINNNSQLASATLLAGATPVALTAPVFLTGGTDGSSAFSDWQNALNLLKQTRVNSIVLLTPDPATAAALDAHCVFMNGVGRNERDGFVGVMDPTQTTVATKLQAKAQALALNTRNLRACPQFITRYNSQGVLTEFNPCFTACVAAGMQAGSGIGNSLTYKYANVLNYRQDASWNPRDDAQEMIQGGLLFMEQVDGVGLRWVRNVTTYLTSNLICYTEGSVNAAVNYAVFSLRQALEFAVGSNGFAGTVNAVQGVAINVLGLLTDAGVITSYQNLLVTTNVDQLNVSVQLAPSIPYNFVTTTIHLVTNNLSANTN